LPSFRIKKDKNISPAWKFCSWYGPGK